MDRQMYRHSDSKINPLHFVMGNQKKLWTLFINTYTLTWFLFRARNNQWSTCKMLQVNHQCRTFLDTCKFSVHWHLWKRLTFNATVRYDNGVILCSFIGFDHIVNFAIGSHYSDSWNKKCRQWVYWKFSWNQNRRSLKY